MASAKRIWFYDNDANNKPASEKINFIKFKDGGQRIKQSMLGTVSPYFEDKPELYKKKQPINILEFKKKKLLI